ncbi:DUF2797 domain-containing protein [Coxiella endosymbiont of Amblyomma nuttalli]|uniref:DUF2797 domain-containing protein n=1 Tax=Coxiella endosymbiont of Amblyomma nuttalli TaxID=2749996 RepID=UPI001BABCFDB|nr:DUF2797 domain-containing protein [Coxiella endosymbiont of Amblyomma nuttalli]QTS83901.1 hypothetical protein CEAn_00379 [Coxiella endosymbiont of Amblyomma nuttalli]
MKKITGHLKKLKTVLNTTIDYYLLLDDKEILLNAFLGKLISFYHIGIICCIQCGRKTNKSFQRGFCFPCLRRLQECNLCIIHPERCQIEKEKCPVDDWAHTHCHQSHVVYLANSSGLKVGITRETHIPTRWIDQGALQAVPIFYTANRYQAGIIEVTLKAFISDRINWRRMLRNETKEVDLIAVRDALLQEAHHSLKVVTGQFKSEDIHPVGTSIVTRLNYPVLQYPDKVKALSLDKVFLVHGRLLGIKGQYLILDSGVVNIQKYSGYVVECLMEEQIANNGCNDK